MRLSTALTLALTALLVTASAGVLAAQPAQPDVAPVTDGDVTDRVYLESLGTHSAASAGYPTAVDSDGDSTPLESPTPQQAIRITVTEDGDALWEIEHYFLLKDDDDIDVFTEYATEVTAGDRDIEYDPSDFERFAEEASEATNREMSIENAGWAEPRNESAASFVALDVNGEPNEGGTEVEPEAETTEIGVISYTFTWTNFATATEDRIFFGDAFRSDDDTWFASVADGQRLIIESPPNYGFDDAPTGYHHAEGGAFVWDGPHQFEAGDLDIVYLRGADGAVGPGVSYLIGGGILVLLFGVGGYLFALRSKRIDLPFGDTPTEPTAAGEKEDTTTAGVMTRGDAELAYEEGATGTGKPRTETEAGGGRGDTTGVNTGTGATTTGPEGDSSADAGPDDGDGDGDVDVELLSDEERVTRLLRQNGGRMKQGQIVDETGWSNAKVSQLLSKMDDEGDIEKLRIGRENLITLPEIDPTEIE